MNGGHELFRVGGVSVRLQGSLLVLGILLAVLALAAGGTGTEVALRLLNPLLLVVTVILHEIGHALVARRLGVTVLDIQLGPMGGMARLLGELRDPKVEGLIAVAGPATNVLFAAATFGLMMATGWGGEVRWEEIVYFLEDESFMQRGPLVVFFGLNVILGVVNLAPAFPSDGGRILRALLSFKLGRLQATRIAARIGIWMAFFLIALPFFARSEQWWITPFIGLFLLFACLKERFVVEAREGLGLGGMGVRIFGAGGTQRPGQPADDPFARPERFPGSHDGAAPDDGVIDVAGESRLIEDEDADERR